jgi:hypothetical protein
MALTFKLFFGDGTPISPPTGGPYHPNLPRASPSKHWVSPTADVEKAITTTAKGGTQVVLTVPNDTDDATKSQSFYFGRFSSPYLAAQTIASQPLTITFWAGQTSGSGATFACPVIYIWRPNTSSVVGYIWDGRNNLGPTSNKNIEWFASGNVVNEFDFFSLGDGVAFTGLTVPTSVSNAVTCENGDVLVVEMWACVYPFQDMSGACPRTIGINTVSSWINLTNALTWGTAAGPAGPVANLTVTEAPDTFTADGSVTWAPRNADLTKTEAADTSVSDVDVIVLTNLTKTETGDSLTSNVTVVPTKADLTKTEAPDTLVSGATMPVVANITKTEAADTLVSAATNPIVINLSITEASDTTITDVDATIQIGFTKTESPDTITASAGAPILNIYTEVTETSDTITATAIAVSGANLNVIEDQDILVADGTVVSSGITAYFSVTESDDYVTANGTVVDPPTINCSFTVVEGGDTLSANGTVAWPIITAGLTVTEQPFTTTVTASVVTPTIFYCVTDPTVVSPTAGTKSPFMPKATNGNAAGSTIEGFLDTYWGGTGNISDRTVSATSVLTTVQSYYFGRFSSRLLAAQTIPAQMWDFAFAVNEASTNANTVFVPVIYVWRPSDSSIQFIFDGSAAGQTEWPTSLTGGTRLFGPGAAVTTQEGDILVIECWAQGAQTTTPGVYLQTWRMTSTTSMLKTQYPVQFVPYSSLYLRQLVAPSAPTAGKKATNLPLATNTNEAAISTELVLNETTVNNPIVRLVNEVSVLGTQQSFYLGRFSTAPLAAQTIPVQAWGWELSCGEASDNANTYHWPVLYIWRPSTSQVVKYIFDAAGPSGVEWRTPNDDPRLNQLFTGASADVQFGDILVLEVWAAGTQTAVAGTYLHRMWTDATNSRIVSPYKLLYTTGPVASFNVTEGADTLTASGTLGALPLITANFTVTEEADVVAVASVVEIAADFVIVDDDDTLIAGLISPLNASLVKTETPDTLVSSVSVLNKANLTKTEAPDTSTSSVKVLAVVNLTKTELADTLVADIDTIVTVNLDADESGDALLSGAISLIGADLTVNELSDTLIADGIVPLLVINANLTVVEAEDVLNATSAAIAISVCDLIAIEAADTLIADVDVIASIALTKTEIGDSLTASIKVSTVVNLTKTEEADTLVSSVVTPIAANLGKTETPDFPGITSTMPVVANLYVVELPDGISASGGSPSATAKSIISEFSPDATVNAGSFAIRTEPSKTVITVKGTGAVVEGSFTTILNSNPYVLCALTDLAGPSVISRTNGVQTDMDTAPLGGMFGNHKLYIGAGSGNREPFQGRLYQYIMRGAQCNAAQIVDIENFVAMKTGTGLPATREVEIMPGVIKRLNRKPMWYQFSPPPWVMLVLVSICISFLLAGCAVAVSDEETEFYMNEVIEYLSLSPLV